MSKETKMVFHHSTSYIRFEDHETKEVQQSIPIPWFISYYFLILLAGLLAALMIFYPFVSLPAAFLTMFTIEGAKKRYIRKKIAENTPAKTETTVTTLENIDYDDVYCWFTDMDNVPEYEHYGPILEQIYKDNPRLFIGALAFIKLEGSLDFNLDNCSKRIKEEREFIKEELRVSLESIKERYFDGIYDSTFNTLLQQSEDVTVLEESPTVEDDPEWGWVEDREPVTLYNSRGEPVDSIFVDGFSDSRVDVQTALDKITRSINIDKTLATPYKD